MIIPITRQRCTNSNKKKHNNKNLKENQNHPGIKDKIFKNGNHPPQNKITTIADIKIIEEYLLKKIMQKSLKNIQHITRN